MLEWTMEPRRQRVRSEKSYSDSREVAACIAEAGSGRT